MADLLNILLWNALEASLLAVAIAVILRTRKFSAPARHLLWLLVLVKLLVPPLAVSPPGLSHLSRSVAALLPRGGAPSGGAGVREEPEPPGPSPAVSGDSSRQDLEIPSLPGEFEFSGVRDPAGLSPLPAPVSSGDPAPPAAEAPVAAPATGGAPRVVASGFLLWISGALALLLWNIFRMVLLEHRLRGAAAVPRPAREAAADIARRLGLRSVPRLVALEGAGPLVWAPGRAVVVLPASLVDGSREGVLRNVLAHELAHLRRRDHRIAWLELLGSCLYWWLPTLWWARHHLRQAADQAADGAAVGILGSRRAYAKSLLETVDLVRAGRRSVPSLGHALGQRDHLERRLTMILCDPLIHRLSWRARVAIAIVALLVLPSAAGRSDGGVEDLDEAVEPAELSGLSLEETEYEEEREQRRRYRDEDGRAEREYREREERAEREEREEGIEQRVHRLEVGLEGVTNELRALRKLLDSSVRRYGEMRSTSRSRRAPSRPVEPRGRSVHGRRVETTEPVYRDLRRNPSEEERQLIEAMTAEYRARVAELEARHRQALEDMEANYRRSLEEVLEDFERRRRERDGDREREKPAESGDPFGGEEGDEEVHGGGEDDRSPRAIQTDVVTINLDERNLVLGAGTEQGVRKGQRFVIHRGAERLAVVEVIRLYPELSFARIISQTDAGPVRRGDRASWGSIPTSPTRIGR